MGTSCQETKFVSNLEQECRALTKWNICLKSIPSEFYKYFGISFCQPETKKIRQNKSLTPSWSTQGRRKKKIHGDEVQSSFSSFS